MRIEPSLNVTPEGSLADIPTAVEREEKSHVPEEGQLGTSSETTYMEIPNTSCKDSAWKSYKGNTQDYTKNKRSK